MIGAISYATGDVNASVQSAGSLIDKLDGGAVADSSATGEVVARLELLGTMELAPFRGPQGL